jgi:hypothetical protein
MLSTHNTQVSPKSMGLRYALGYALLCFFPIGFLTTFTLTPLFLERYSLPGNLGALLFHSIIVSISGSIGASVPTYFAYRNLFDASYAGRSSVDYVRVLEVPLPYHVALGRCESALSALGNPHILLKDPAQGRIEAAVTPNSIWQALTRYGTRISIRLRSDQPEATVLEIASRATLSSYIFGHGRNVKNVERIAAYLNHSEASV